VTESITPSTRAARTNSTRPFAATGPACPTARYNPACGIRPKLHGPQDSAADFLIQGPEVHGVQGLVNLVWHRVARLDRSARDRRLRGGPRGPPLRRCSKCTPVRMPNTRGACSVPVMNALNGVPNEKLKAVLLKHC